ncbi:UNVERIFIED_CONTAM: hypothetical protein B566_EDAN018900 [Ephemera danica]|nr:hypothetical protein B566_EDAN018900 [Ephemera danica]
MLLMWPHRRGEELARELECPYLEVSAAESLTQVSAAFQTVCREVLTARRRGKQSLLDRMLNAGKARTPSPRTYLRGKSDSALP